MWLLFALAGPILWAASTHIDKYLVERYFKQSDTAVLMVFTALIGAVMLPFIWFADPSVISLPLASIVVMVVSGFLYMGAMLFYLRAIQSEEASVVVPLFQLQILITLFLAYVLLGETLTPLQFGGGALILAGTLTVSFESGMHRAFRLRLILLMLGCTFVLSLSSVVFKLFAVADASYWGTTFWTFAGEALFGVGILMRPSYRIQLRELLRQSPGSVFGINGANELINLGGGLAARFASLLVPVALVSAISSTASLFVFIIGIGLTFLAPRFGREDLSARSLVQKGIAAILVVAGVILIGPS